MGLFGFNADIWISIGVGVSQLALGWMGFRVSARPPQTGGGRTAFEAAFVVVGLLGIGLTAWSGYRSQSDLSHQIKHVETVEVSGLAEIEKRLPIAPPIPQRAEQLTPTKPRPIVVRDVRDTPASPMPLIEALKPFARQITISYANNDPDGLRLSTKWLDLFKRAGWQTGTGVVAKNFSRYMLPLSVSISPTDKRPEHGQVQPQDAPAQLSNLFDVLAKNKKPVPVWIDTSLSDPQEIEFTVGNKP